MSQGNLIFKGGRIVTMDDQLGVIDHGDVLIEDGVITYVGPEAPTPAGDTVVVDAEGGIITPGFVDTHRHCWMTCLRGLNVDHTLMEYLEFVRQNVVNLFGVEDIFLGNHLGALEALDAGITTVFDHSHNIIGPEYADAAVEGLRRAGIRAVFGYGFHDGHAEHSGFDSPEDRYRDARRIAKSLEDNPLLGFGVALSETGMVPWSQTKKEIAVGRELGGLITLHMACAPGLAVCTGLNELVDQGLLGPDFVLSHGVLLSDEQLDMVRDAGASIAVVHDSELGMGEGPVVLHRAFQKGLKTGFGADFAPLINGDLFGMIRLSLAVTRGALHADTVARGELIGSVGVPMRYFLEMATVRGAEALGLGTQVGSLTPGKRGDVVLLKPEGMSLVPLPEPIESYPLYTSSRNVNAVAVDGRLVKNHGELLGVDLQDLRSRAEESHERVYAAGARAPFAMSPQWREENAAFNAYCLANMAAE